MIYITNDTHHFFFFIAPTPISRPPKKRIMVAELEVNFEQLRFHLLGSNCLRVGRHDESGLSHLLARIVLGLKRLPLLLYLFHILFLRGSLNFLRSLRFLRSLCFLRSLYFLRSM